jgi:DMSO/TMAO reductase YedYZ molybdopterin-dependent catalytic subunit
LVGGARTLGLDDLKARRKSTVEAVHQCCGNPLEPNLPTRRVVNVRWGGADLAALLDELDVDPRARFLWSNGLDGGAFAGTDCDWYVKDNAAGAAGGVLVAYEMNDKPLTAEHGFPCGSSCPATTAPSGVAAIYRLTRLPSRALAARAIISPVLRAKAWMSTAAGSVVGSKDNASSPSLPCAVGFFGVSIARPFRWSNADRSDPVPPRFASDREQ